MQLKLTFYIDSFFRVPTRARHGHGCARGVLYLESQECYPLSLRHVSHTKAYPLSLRETAPITALGSSGPTRCNIRCDGLSAHKHCNFGPKVAVFLEPTIVIFIHIHICGLVSAFHLKNLRCFCLLRAATRCPLSRSHV